MKLPITEKGDLPQEAWAQQEYVACYARAYGFSAGGDWWHYQIGYDRISRHMPAFGPAKEPITGKIKSLRNWIAEAAEAVAKAERVR